MSYIKTWNERCDEHPDHQSGMVSNGMIQARMQEEIDDLRAENERLRDEDTQTRHALKGWVFVCPDGGDEPTHERVSAVVAEVEGLRAQLEDRYIAMRVRQLEHALDAERQTVRRLREVMKIVRDADDDCKAGR